MDTAMFFSALGIGFFGSFHCIGMCGPIALALPKGSGSQTKIIIGRTLYNAGRIVTYSILGFIAGIIGYSFSLKGFQNDLSILTGVIILIFVLIAAGSRHSAAISLFISRQTAKLKKPLHKLFKVNSYFALFLIGLINGLLPCGFVYLALAGALACGHFAGGAIYMGMFGIGTLPLMLSVSIAGHFIRIGLQKHIKRIAPIIAIILAAFLIYRGSEAKTKSCCNNKTHTACAYP